MRPSLRSVLFLFVIGICLNSPAFAQFDNLFGPDKTVAQQREAILTKSTQTLQDLYNAQPKAKQVVEKGIAYATFSNFGMKILPEAVQEVAL